MASNLRPTFAYTVIYVRDVARSVDFYAKAFGLNIRRLDHSHRWGELESGQTTIAFTPIHQHETDEVTGSVQTAQSKGERGPIEVCLDFSDNGAVPVSAPAQREWGQTVGYVRDPDGIVVRMGSHVTTPSQT
ncbi:hypothetical protein Nepgr_014134 [Nepenthes gracilis]|uniref:VOC domain-containing protein n=1 Tax=Nepenthes gracilis TaxID=150966 RepID=A0AAD3SJG6_NEPGR|nr:hypothetical protein Nepgr_014134 [Nepenthes gracilis]